MRLCTTATGRAPSKSSAIFLKELIVMPIHMCALTGFVVRARVVRHIRALHQPLRFCAQDSTIMKEVMTSEARMKTSY
eukprot:547754-Pleurochrysis_carterae.AAC.2